jgi:ribonuclease D
MAAPDKPLYIDDRRAHSALCDQLRGHDILALDTEFIREKSYVPKLEIVQVATRDGLLAVIDYATLGRMDNDPFVEILLDPTVLKIFHAAEQDLEMFHLISGRVPGPMWDTQLVTGLMGYTGRLGYAAVAENMLGAKPAKGETLTDWSQRPLTPEQLHYAIEDVRYLIPLYDLEREKLESLGRLEWAHEECERDRQAVEDTLAVRADQSTLYQRVRGWHNLDRRGLAVLRELAMWREDEALRRNRPRGSVLKDEMLVEIARRSPNHAGQLRALRGLQPRDLDRHGEDMVAAVKAGKAVPADECPVPGTPGPQLADEEMALASLLQAVLQAIAADRLVSPTLVATSSDLQRLVEAYVNGRADESPVVTGWRGELVGHDLMGILEGRAAVVWDPAKKAIRIEQR